MTLLSTLRQPSRETRLQSNTDLERIAGILVRRRAVRHLQKGRVAVLGGGTGNPDFTTTTADILRGPEIGSSDLFEVTSVSSGAPKLGTSAHRLTTMALGEASRQGLRVRDRTAFAPYREPQLPVIVLGMHAEGSLRCAVRQYDVGTCIHRDGSRV